MARKKKEKGSEFAKNVRTLMDAHKLSLKATAAVAEVSSSTLATWLSGAAPSDFAAVQRLSDHFNVTTAWLLTSREDKTSGNHAPTVSEALAPAGFLFNGFARITVEKLIPRNELDQQIEDFDRSTKK